MGPSHTTSVQNPRIYSESISISVRKIHIGVNPIDLSNSRREVMVRFLEESLNQDRSK